jgi:hypothetical protein
LSFFFDFTLKTENPFELILERLERIEIAIQKLKLPTIKDDKEVLLSRIETATLLKFSLTVVYSIFHTKNYKL